MCEAAMAEFTVRLARPDDLMQLDQMMARSYARQLKADYPPSTLVMALPLISRAQPRLLGSGRYFVAEIGGGEIIGAGGWSRAHDPRLGHVRHLVTHYRHTRQGVASAIIGTVLEAASSEGVQRLDCQSTLTAAPFYRSVGFEGDERIEIELRPGIRFPAIAMQRRI
jgi:GNAT superfamily N-acetyltransferase